MKVFLDSLTFESMAGDFLSVPYYACTHKYLTFEKHDNDKQSSLLCLEDRAYSSVAPYDIPQKYLIHLTNTLAYFVTDVVK